MLRFFHTGDLHPNAHATFAGRLPIDPATGRNLALTDLRQSLDHLFQVVTAHDPNTRCDFGVIPGDVFDSVEPTMDEVQIIVEFAERVAEHMPVFIIPGNHDMGQSTTRATALEPLKLREQIFVFERPESFSLPIKRLGQSARLFMLPYPQKGRLLASQAQDGKSPEEILALINHGLAAILRAFTLDLHPDGFNVLLAHGTTSSAKVGVQPRSIANDILIPLEDCRRFNYIALNHIHARQQVAANAFYSGSLCRQDFGEEHEQKGFNLVELQAGQPARVTFIENPHARTYRTITPDELGIHIAAADSVVRVKGELTPDAYLALKPRIQHARERWPYFQDAIKTIVVDRARDAGMARCLTVDEQLARALEGKAAVEELPAVLEKHHGLLQEVGG